MSAAPVPNNHVLEAAGLGLIAPYGDDDRLAELALEATRRPWNREAAVRHVVEHHSWDVRVQQYEEVIRQALLPAEAR